MARKAPREDRRVFVSTDYGLATQEDREIDAEGNVGKSARRCAIGDCGFMGIE
jgi:hypothetical protein